MKTFSHTRPTTCLGLLLFALLTPSAMAASPPAMAADNCTAPPGTSGIDQYCEALPSPGGPGSGAKHHSQQGHRLPPATTKALERQGPTGAAVLALTRSGPGAGTQSATPQPRRPLHRSHRRSTRPLANIAPARPTRRNAGPVSSAPRENPVSAVGNSISGSGLGAGFIGALVAIGILLAGVALLGRRRPPSDEIT